MPIFELEANGKTFEIDAPDQGAALSAFQMMSSPARAPTPRNTIEKAVGDVPKEVAGAFTEGVDAVKAGTTGYLGNEVDRLKDPNKSLLQGAKERFSDIAKVPGAVAGAAGALFSPLTGAARSLIGHPLADAAPDDIVQKGMTFEKRHVPEEERYATAKGGVDLAMSANAPGKRTIPTPAPTAAELKAAAKAVYQDPAIKAIQIPTTDVAALASRIETGLTRSGFRTTPGSAPGTLSEIQRLQPAQGVQSVAVDDLRAARRALNLTAKQRDPIGQPTPDAAAASKAISQLDQYLDGLAPSLKEANANYSAAKQAELVDFRAAKAKNRADTSGTGGNVENTLRQEVAKISDRGLKPNERELRDRIVSGSPTRNTLRTVGKLGVDGGLSLLLNSAAALGSGGATIPVTAGATAARKIAEMLTKKDVRALNESIRSRAPLAQMLARLPAAPNRSKKAQAIAAMLSGQNLGGVRMNLPLGVMPAGAEQNQ